MADAPLFLRPPVDAATTDIAVAPVDGSGGQRQELANGPFFGVTRRLIDGDDCRYETTFEVCAVVEGSGDATVAGERYLLQTGDHFVLPAGSTTAVSGSRTIIPVLDHAALTVTGQVSIELCQPHL